MKKIALLITIILLNISVFSQNDNDAKSLLDDVAEKVEKL